MREGEGKGFWLYPPPPQSSTRHWIWMYVVHLRGDPRKQRRSWDEEERRLSKGHTSVNRTTLSPSHRGS